MSDHQLFDRETKLADWSPSRHYSRVGKSGHKYVSRVKYFFLAVSMHCFVFVVVVVVESLFIAQEIRDADR